MESLRQDISKLRRSPFAGDGQPKIFPSQNKNTFKVVCTHPNIINIIQQQETSTPDTYKLIHYGKSEADEVEEGPEGCR
jgi:hypothetical protein